MLKICVPLVILISCGVAANAQVVTVTTQDGQEQAVSYRGSTFKRAGVRMNSGDVLDYSRIATISTDNFDAYEDTVTRTARRGNEHVTVKFTGDENVNALRLERLERRRNSAGVAGGVGGFLALIGILSGDDELRAVGMATMTTSALVESAAADQQIAAQNRTIVELQRQQREEPDELTLEDHYRLEYGNENLDSLIALIDRNYERALALANAGETSSDSNYRLAAVWMKTIVQADRGNRQAVPHGKKNRKICHPE